TAREIANDPRAQIARSTGDDDTHGGEATLRRAAGARGAPVGAGLGSAHRAVSYAVSWIA
ncbi:hypothetical protein, partial [Intrasporangium sp.]|uniref:hypothetical protein n=1 Tax=Intrasporangium sp. TaxID=1925024 RepID=UPI0029398925